MVSRCMLLAWRRDMPGSESGSTAVPTGLENLDIPEKIRVVQNATSQPDRPVCLEKCAGSVVCENAGSTPAARPAFVAILTQMSTLTLPGPKNTAQNILGHNRKPTQTGPSDNRNADLVASDMTQFHADRDVCQVENIAAQYCSLIDTQSTEASVWAASKNCGEYASNPNHLRPASKLQHLQLVRSQSQIVVGQHSS